MIIISRHIIIFLFSGLTALLFAQSNNFTLTGRVTDSDSGEPIELVNVYLSGTTFGASTSQTGIYYMENIPAGYYQLIFQHIGYEIRLKDILIEDSQRYEIDAQLLPKIYNSEDIQVITTEPTEWKKQLIIFIKEFIGKSPNATDCEILNPEVLNFQIDQDNNNFIAATDSIIRIVNNALGYKLYVVLDEFRCKDNLLSIYRIYPRFELLQARDEEEQEQWFENRRNTFISSFKHFLSALARGRIMEGNFKMSKAENKNRLSYGYGNYVRGDSLKIEDMDRPLYKKFYLDDYLKISYLPRQIHPPSIIKLKKDYIIIDTLGNILTPGQVTRSGAWYKARVADTLPWEYLPN